MDKRPGDRPEGSTLERPATAPVEPREASLLRLVERSVLPRLAERQPGPVLRDRFGGGLSAHVPALADLALLADDGRAMALLHDLHRAGRSFSQLQLGLIAPTARRLDAIWQRDGASFVEVTQATGTLKRLMRFVALDLSPRHQMRMRYKTVLVAPAPGESHDLGAAMAAEYFRRDGWAVHYVPGSSAVDLAGHAGRGWLDAVAFSLTTEQSAPALAEAVALIRRASLNRRVVVVAGGEAFVRRPSLTVSVGSDAALAPLPAAPGRTLRLVRAMYGLGG